MTLKGVFTSIPALKDAFVSLLFHLCKVVSISFYALHSYEILMSLKQQSSFQITLRDSALIVLWWLRNPYSSLDSVGDFAMESNNPLDRLSIGMLRNYSDFCLAELFWSNKILLSECGLVAPRNLVSSHL